MVLFDVPDSIWSNLIVIYQLMLGKPYYKLGHCKAYILSRNKVTRLTLGWDGLLVQDLQWGKIYEEENTSYVVPVHLGVPEFVLMQKRLGLIKSLSNQLGDKHFRFSVWSCVGQLLGKGYPFFNCSSLVSYILFGTIEETPNDLMERLIHD